MQTFASRHRALGLTRGKRRRPRKAEAVTRSVELIVQPDAHAAPGPLIVAVAVEPICGLRRGAPASGARRGPDWVRESAADSPRTSVPAAGLGSLGWFAAR